MTRSSVTVVLVAMALAVSASPRAQNSVDLSGKWTLNPSLSAGPTEVGFGADWVGAAGGPESGGSGGSSGGGGRGRRGGGGGGGGSRTGGALPFARPQSEDDAKRVRQLTDEVREPSAHLTIADTMTAVTITTDRGQSRTFHPDGRDDVIQLEGGVPVSVNAKRDPGGALIVLYHVQEGREGRQLRYTYTRNASPAQLAVEVQFIERGGGDQVKRVYEPTSANESTKPTTQTQTQAPGQSPSQQAQQSPQSQQTPPGQTPPGQTQPPPFNQQPDAELKGLRKLGVVVEGVSEQATACGVKQKALETAVSKRLTDAGFKVQTNSDEDSYVYVNVMTSSLSNGYCISRYDAFVMTHTTAKLSYQDVPVLIEVQLLHKGGMTGGPPTTHGDGVVKGVLEYVDQFTTRIRAANGGSANAAP
jgi:hypothetical protein